MRLKLLLLLLLISGGLLNAQDTIRSLVITEARLNAQSDNYVEITNMGNDPVNMKDFEFGTIHPWTVPWNSYSPNFFRLPDQLLQPGESYVITVALDFGPEQYAKKTPGFEGDQQKPQKTQMYNVADMLIHMAEQKGDETDSVTIDPIYGEIAWTFECWGGRECYYIEQHLSDIDSVIVDQVSGVFDESDGTNRSSGRYDVAGVTGATGTAILVRKFKVKQGNIDFANARGVGADDSEWIPWQWPAGWGQWRDAPWTVGNHGDYKLDENTLESDVADVDFAGKTITVPWGTRRGDGVMHLMKKKPGLAWIYDLNPNYEDSLSFAAHTGDKLNLTVFGSEGYKATFDIIVSEPSADVNIVVPVTSLNYPESATQWWRDDNQQGIIDWPRITEHTSGPDTITGTWYGIPYATRIDSLLKRLEKPSNAEWEIVPASGVASPDIKYGDKLKVTAQNGAVKEYFIEVQPIQPNHVAFLSSITWPDIPAEYKGLYGWTGDTIPGFNRVTTNYKVSVPFDVDGIPALVAKTENLNATVKVTRASSISGSTEERTVTFEVTAEDDSVKLVYNVELIKEKSPANLQPFIADPFLSEYYFSDNWANSFIEICNPGNMPLDLSGYMVAWEYDVNPSSVIQSRMAVEDWINRYDKYIPGYKWVNQEQWAVTPGYVEQDLNVNAIVYPGDVFCYGTIIADGNTYQSWMGDYKWPVPGNLDVQFNNYTNNTNKRWFPNGYTNPWNEEVTPNRPWYNSSWYMFKILNDSITRGLKPANDPNDFLLIETWSMSSSTRWIVGGVPTDQITNYMRKPEIYKGNTGFDTAGSFGTNLDDCEWTWTNTAYWQAKNVGWPYYYINEGNDIGQHYMYTPTHYKSTVSSTVYKVSEGYSMNEKIIGTKTGTTVADFLSAIIKANEKQTLTLMRGDAALTDADVLLAEDKLVVLSADSTNTTKYALTVTDEGLSSNAVLTSSKYTVTVDIQPKSAGNDNAGMGNVKGFEYGTALRTILANITVPAGASMTVIDANGAYVPLKMLNFDTTYVNVTVNDYIYLDVIAENGVTEIVYQLLPTSTESEAFVLSDIYNVLQKESLIEYVPRGTSVSTLFSNLVASAGAKMIVVDKMGYQRFDGGVADDDKVVVTSADGTVSKVYYISKLSSAATPETLYLAYILSNVYSIDQVDYKVSGVSGTESVSTFLTKVTPAPGATAVVVDAAGAVKTTGDIDNGDMVKVTSASGQMVVTYTFGPLTSSKTINTENIELYPNPTNGVLNISGLKAGYRIVIYNSVGAAVREVNVQSNVERISLSGQSTGMYMVVISDNNKMLGRYKVLKQ